MTSESLLETLEHSGLIADDVLAATSQVAASGGKLDPAAIVRQLVEQEHLTKAQGAKLLGTATPRPHHATIEVEPDDELELLDDDDQATRGGLTGGPRSVPDDLEVLPDEEELLPPPPPPSRKPSVPSAPKPAPRPEISQRETRAAGDDDLGLAPIENDPLLSSPLRKPAKGSTSRKASDSVAPEKPGKRKGRRTCAQRSCAVRPSSPTRSTIC